MAWAGEEDRATAYRAQVRRRVAAEKARAAALRGNGTAATALRARWAWLLDPPVPVLELPDSEQPLA